MSPDPGSATPPVTAPPGMAQTTEELRSRRDLARQLVVDDGVVVGKDPDEQPRHLTLDPVPLVIPAADWAELERALTQRAVLLDLILADLYGERSLVARGLLPPELVVGHPGFLPQADGIPTRHGLFLTAADLGHDQDGRWCVVADRAQRPAGAGYAMAVRRIIARVLAPRHRETDLRRLRDFFDAMRGGLRDLATGATEGPRVVILTPPGAGESSFDDMITATLLGFPVVRGEELTIRGGRLWLRTTERPEPVDVILRRVDAGRADPLDLGPSEGAGIPGLVEATRRGVVSVVNPLGAGVLENPALCAFLPQIARALLGEDLRLPSVPTRWCGDPAEFAYVRAHLADLVLAPIAPGPGNPRVFAGTRSTEERAELLARIEDTPWAWCAQDVLPTWSAQVVTDTGLEARRGLLRTFTLADARGTMVLPGGLARVTAGRDDLRVPTLRDAIVKDVWVLAGAGEESPAVAAAYAPPGEREESPAALFGTPLPLSSRAAEDLYWFGRYAERAESTARLLLVADDLIADHIGRPGTAGFHAMQIVMDAIDDLTSIQRDRPSRGPARDAQRPVPAEDPIPHLRTLVFNGARRGTVRYSANRATRAAAQVRELLSADTWLVLSQLERTLAPRGTAGDQLPTVLARVVESFLALAGMGAEGLVRDAIWAFQDAGRRVERSQETVRLLRRTVTTTRSARVDRLVLEAVLRSRDSVISFRRRLAESGLPRAPAEIALGLLLTDTANPRSVLFQLERLREDLARAPASAASALAAAASVAHRLDTADLRVLSSDDEGLSEFLTRVEDGLRELSGTLDATCFRHRTRQWITEEPAR